MGKVFQKSLILLLALSLCGCSVKTAPEKHSVRFFAMDTVMDVSVYSDQDPDALLERCRNRVSELDGLFSVHNPSGDLSRLNQSGGSTVSVAPETVSEQTPQRT